MLWQALLYLLPFLALAYYLKSNWPEIKNKRLIFTLLIAGSLMWFVGLLLQNINFDTGSLISLFGVSVFFTGVVINTIRQSKKEEDVADLEKEEN